MDDIQIEELGWDTRNPMMDDIQIEEVGLNDSSQKSSDLKSRVQAKDIIMKNAN